MASAPDRARARLRESVGKAVHRSRPMIRGAIRPGNGQGAPFAAPAVSAAHTTEDDPSHRILTAIIATIGSTANTGEVIARTVQTLTSPGLCAGALIYLWDADAKHLRLVGSESGATAEPECQLGEGLVGRAALSADAPLAGTLTVAGASRGRARIAPIAARAGAVAVRMTARDGDLLGVLCLLPSIDSGAPPPPWSMRVAVDVGRLLGIAIEHERVSDASRRLDDLLGSIELLARSVTAEASLAEGLSNIAAIGLRTLRAAACAVYITERGQPDMHLMALAPRGAELPPTWRGGLTWDRQHGDGARPIAAASPGGVPRQGVAGTRSVLAAPAVLGTDRVGAVLVFDEGERAYNDAERRLCERLARVVAIAIRQRRILDGTIERSRSEDLLWEIVGPGSADRAAVLARAQRLGCDLMLPRVVVVAAVITAAATIERLRAAIAALDRTALVDAAGDRLVAIISPEAVAAIPVGPYSVGVSQATRDLARYPLAYRQAQEALELGVRLFGAGRVVRFEDLGSYRFVPALIQCGLTAEAEYEQVSRLSDELLRTLEAYLDCGGNTALAAKQLFLHRNTLRQRLERISSAMDIELASPSRWLPLQLAIKTARMARLAPAAGPGSPPTR